MPNKIEEITKLLEDIEAKGTRLIASDNHELLRKMEGIEKFLAYLQDVFIAAFQSRCMSEAKINTAIFFTAIGHLQL